MSDKLCPHCGTPNATQARFCAGCGKQLPSQPVADASSMTACPRCGTSLRSGARFCPTCGYNTSQPIPAAAPQAAPPSPPPSPPQQPGRAAAPGTQLLSETGGSTNLVLRWMGGDTQQFPLSKPTVTIGRAPDNDIVVNHPAVSGHHLSMSETTGRFSITDLNSTNGTMLNGHRISPNTSQSLNMGDVIRIGDLTGNSVSLVLQGESGPSMRALSLGQLDLSNLTSVVIGRDPSSYLPLNHPTVSSRHAMISKQNGGLVIRDLGSTNGTFVNGTRISNAVPLASGDVIQIGPFRLSYDAQQQSLAQSMGLGHRIDTVNLGREVANKKMILNNVSMTINPGEFVALVGGSGAGKSTLMKAMNGYDQANHGQILLDGEPLYPNLDLYRTQMGYVPQDDIIHRELPVRLALWYAAKLRLPDAKPAEIQARIQEALRAVDMVEHAEKRVRVLSGGQRKRVSIAVELLARPTLFFLDEPTSGLDPGLEKKMMYDLNKLADEGRTVVLVTHATANIEQCDHVAFLTYGRLSYYGPPNDALKFFDVRDFSDIYLKLSQEINPSKGKPVPPELQPYYPHYQSQARVVAGVLLADHYSQSQYFKKFVTDRQKALGPIKQSGGLASAKPSKRARDSFIRQMFILARRQFDLIRLDLRTLFILLLMMPLIGALFTGVAAADAFVGREGTAADIERELKLELEGAAINAKSEYTPVAGAQTLVSMLGLALTQGGTFAAAYEIVKERGIFRRERAVNLSVVAYVLSKVMILGVFAFIQVVSVLLVLSLKVDLDFPGAVFPDSGVLELFITLYLGVLASILFGLCISALVPNTDIVLYAILVQLFVQIIFAGTLFPIKSEIASKGVIGYWVTDAFGSTVDMDRLNEAGQVCKVVEVEIPSMTGGDPTKEIRTSCDEAAINLELDYQHTEEHIYQMWIGLAIHIVVWCLLTIIIQARKKAE